MYYYAKENGVTIHKQKIKKYFFLNLYKLVAGFLVSDRRIPLVDFKHVMRSFSAHILPC